MVDLRVKLFFLSQIFLPSVAFLGFIPLILVIMLVGRGGWESYLGALLLDQYIVFSLIIFFRWWRGVALRVDIERMFLGRAVQ